MLTWALLLLLAAAAQPQTIHPSRRQEALVASRQTVDPSNERRHPDGRSPPEIPLLRHDIPTVKFRSTNEDAINGYEALAPAREISAVRDSLVQSAQSSRGHVALPQARLLRGWEAENIVLLATIDGEIHARDRKTGAKRWTLGIPDTPMIQTTHHCNNNTGDEGDEYCDHDFIFIVEPTKDGDLYMQHKDPEIGLQRLGTTVKKLVEKGTQFIDEPALVMTGGVDHSGYVVDAASGNVLQQYSKHSVYFNDDEQRSCRQLSGFELDDPACPPIGKLNLGRVEYTVTISNRETKRLLCTIKYAEWVPNTNDEDMQQQYVAPLDNTHIQVYYNGRIQGHDTDSEFSNSHRWWHPMDSPVARVFDVVRPSGNQAGDTNLVLLSRPIDSPALTPSRFWREDTDRMNKVFVNKTETGGWYAMSELAYPGITFGAPRARSDWELEQNNLDFAVNMEDMVGLHTLSEASYDASNLLTIEGRTQTQESMLEPEKAVENPYLSTAPSVLDQVTQNWSILVNVILFGIVVMIAGIQLRIPAILRLQKMLRKAGIEIALDSSPTAREPSASEIFSHGDVPVAKTDATEEVKASKILEEVLDSAMATPVRSRAQSTIMTNASPKKDNKIDGEDENSSDAGSDDDREQGASGEQALNPESGSGPKRKAKRGKRGGRKNKKKAMDPEAMNEVDALVAEIPTRDGLLQVGKLRIDTKEDTCLGRGSNGTTVFPGTLDGREVAVKRLIRSSNSLAAKEIKHLLSSEQNSHVIRFLLKEESQHFTYIALDLFTTSLDQFIERPEKFPSLVKMPEGYDVKDCLKQITDGVAHLHSLKLVHRDIKPQNVLVNPLKSSRPITGLPRLHFVISDFGLAKPLEEGPESTFAPTANHTAAGTTGWRAPELLVNYRDTIAAPSATSSVSKSTSYSGDGTAIDRPSGRRATKAIDIFSLGCVFYYVMTQGRHPFDVGGSSLGRDLNIRDNNFTTDDLKLFEYCYEGEDLIMQMVNHDPKLRPDTAAVLGHPYFWPVKDRLEFLLAMSDCYEDEKNSIKDIHNPDAVRTEVELDSLNELAVLEELAPDVIGKSNDFLRALPRSFITEMGKQRKYTGSKMIDLLRVIRNKRNHFRDLAEDVKEQMSYDDTAGYYQFWAKRFPSLLVNCHCLLLERGLVQRWKSQRLGDIIERGNA